MESLPEEVISNVSSYLIGEPKDLKMKNNKALRQIQNKYKPDINIKDNFVHLLYGFNHREDYIDLEEDYILCVEPKVKRMEYAMKLILRQKDMVKQCINQSHLLYLQPDMDRKIEIYVESLIELKSRYNNETNTPFIRRVCFGSAEPWELEDDIDEALEYL